MGRLFEKEAAALAADLVALRRSLHTAPEVGLHLPGTQALVLDALAGTGLSVRTGENLSSVVAVLDGAGPGPTVVLRGDMDALPVRERTGLPFAAEGEAMHACGHDLHTAGLIGAVRLLAARREEISGSVVFMFQPGEEGYDGAGLMLDEGLLDATPRPPDAAYALHVVADLPAGRCYTRPGPIMASYGVLEVTVTGRGGHGGRPHEALDPIPVAAEAATALQTYVTRRFDAFEPVVVTVGEFHAGTAPNVIPEHAVFRAGVRSFSDPVTERLAAELPALVEGIAAAHGARAEATFETVLPATVNSPEHAALFAETARALFGDDRFEELARPRIGSEDFSRVLRRVPGAYGYLGAAPADAPGHPSGNHSPTAVFDDSVTPDAARLLAALAWRHVGPSPAPPSTHRTGDTHD
ncbi:amidohydrolase [Streptomyces sp. SID8361]|uniref:M20 metallopeptidase family protein n=1 Tax=Streptomyces sp. MnatMP-M27 TaxID=1839768 RepID=UPI00081E4927|nr:M20 family metallopeptidase [Streptomyces sp. MnatMP-M27]MYU18075.1 amidohydrolase [Streptomyces sp. SID8361]SCG12611.1 hippurate hydrolase [Streptomyces sp. MnatMP-M27]